MGINDEVSKQARAFIKKQSEQKEPRSTTRLLKQALCVGAARRVILDRPEDRYQQHFADQWEFVRFATEQRLGLDFTSPPQRSEPAR
jgi:hypothetical protein